MFLPFCYNSCVWQTDRRTRTERRSAHGYIPRCTQCSTVKTFLLARVNWKCRTGKCWTNFTLWFELKKKWKKYAVHCCITFTFIVRWSVLIITVLHWMQGGSVTRKLLVRPSVRPFICLSNARFFTERKKFVPTFLHRWPRWSKNANFQSIFALSASAVTPSEKINWH